MKTLSVLALASTTLAIVLLPFSATLGAATLFVTGFAAIVIADYTRPARVLRLPTKVAVGARTERFGLAA